jgi:hypothetical protein
MQYLRTKTLHGHVCLPKAAHRNQPLRGTKKNLLRRPPEKRMLAAGLTPL